MGHNVRRKRHQMKRFFVPMLAAVLLLATDRPGVRPRGAAKDYPAFGSADRITIAVVVVPAGKVQHQLSREIVKGGYTVFEIAVYPGPGKAVDVSSDDFSMTVGSNPDVARAETPAELAASVEGGKRVNQPQIPGRVEVHGEQTVGVSSGGRDPVTGRRYPGSVYTEAGVGVGVGEPRVGDPPSADPRYPRGDPRNPDPGVGGAAQQGAPRSVREKLEEKALPEGRTAKAVAGYVYFPKVSPRLVNSSEPYHVTYRGPTSEIHLTVPAK
jgi:hypothetical protein